VKNWEEFVMRSEYLWDRSGEPDPEIQRLEEVLGRLRSSEAPAERRPSIRVRPVRRPWIADVRWRGALAAGIALVVGASWLASRPVGAGWKVARVEGEPRVGSSPIRTTGQLTIGQTLTTDSTSRAKLDVWNVGEVEVEPASRLRLVRSRQTGHRFALDRGTLHATIWAPPGLFSVETPAAVAVDLGCAYTIKVDGSGTTTLDVTLGWVGFEQNGHESWVPAGAECITRTGARPGTPYFVDASDDFRAALSKFDFEHDALVLDAILAAARPRDALTLWHLLPKTGGDARIRVYDRMVELAPPPAGVAREGVLSGDRHMLDLWWKEIGLGDPSFWRLWKAPSPIELNR
jgi:hypothetical protein